MIADVLFTSKIWTPPKSKFQTILLCELFQVQIKKSPLELKLTYILNTVSQTKGHSGTQCLSK